MSVAETGYLCDERYLTHDAGEERMLYPSAGLLEPVTLPLAARVLPRTHALVVGSGLVDLLVPLAAQAATEDVVALCHERAYIARVRDLCTAGSGDVGAIVGYSAPVVPASYETALLAVGGALAAVDAVMDGRVGNAYALLSPSGHHAMPAEALGTCLFNNVAIAARYAQQRYRLRRIMIVDWDVHHGNGTQAIFYDDPDVLFTSLHQENWFPRGSGAVEEVGTDGAVGRTINVPLPPGTGDRGYLEACERVIRPIAQQFQPELLLISAGQDPNMMDPFSRTMVTMDGFRAMATAMREIAADACAGRLVALHEGGYSSAYVPFCTLAVIEGLLDRRSAIVDPNSGEPELAQSQHEHHERQVAAIDRAIAIQRAYWAL